MNSLARALSRPQTRFGLLALGPIVLWYLAFWFAPVAGAFYMSLHDWNMLRPELSPFVLLGNYAAIPSSELFWTALGNSVRYALAYAIVVIPISLFLATLLDRVVRGRNLFLFCYFLPVVMSIVATSVLFMWLYQPTFGIVNIGLRYFGLPAQRFLESHDQSLYSIVSVDVWKHIGFYTVIYLAGLLNIPESYYDAAKVDGAGPLHIFRHITLPMLANTTLFVFVIVAIHGFQVFTPVHVMTGGGPGRSSYVLSLLVYQEGLSYFRMGFSAAVSFVLFAIVFVITLIQLRLLKPRWDY